MTDRNRRAFLAGALGGAGGAGVFGYARKWYVTRREEIRLRPVTLVNGNTEPRDVYVRIYTRDGYEADRTLTLEAAETDRANVDVSTTTRALHGPWEELTRRYALTVVHGARGWPLADEEIRAELAADGPGADVAEVRASVNSSMFSVHVSAPGGSPIG